MSSRWANPINNNILRDLEGTILGGGSLEFYAAGTSTPLAVYSDSDLSVSLGSTLTADAFGLIEDFHMAAGTEYKMIAKDSGGTTKWTRDDVFSLDSSVDTRIDALETSVAAISGSSNAVRNSSCQKQRIDSNGNVVTAPSISSSFQQGTVAGHYFKASNVSAGTITRGSTTDITSGYYAACSAVTTTNSASTVDGQFRVAAGDAGRFVNGSGVFSIQVYQDTGSAIDYTITIKKADAEDDFSATTTIATSGTTSVVSGTWTEISFSNSALGDCRNGLAIEVSAACGVQTTKNYWFTMPQMETGTTATTWGSTPVANDFAGLEYTPRKYAAEFINSTTIIQTDTDASHDILVPSGSGCRDSSDSFDIDTTADITKQIDAVWAEGDNAGGRPSGITLSGPEWLYFFLIAKTDGTVDAGFDSSATAANLLSDASTYTYYRRIGIVRTDGSDNIDLVIPDLYIGKRRYREVYTSNGTALWPPGVLTANVTVVGGGGGGDQPAGAAGGNGGDSTAVYNGITITGGGGTGAGASVGTGGTATNGDYNVRGQTGFASGEGGSAGLGFGHSGFSYGSGGSGTAAGFGGGGGGAAVKLFEYDTADNDISITVGAAGAAGSGSGTTAGTAGVVIVEWQ